MSYFLNSLPTWAAYALLFLGGVLAVNIPMLIILVLDHWQGNPPPGDNRA